MALPRYAVLKAVDNNKYLAYFTHVNQAGETYAVLQSLGEEVYNPTAKLAIEAAETQDGLVNIRCCYNNKYWALSQENKLISPISVQTDEDQSNDTCTLFKPIYVDEAANKVRFMHVQSQRYAYLFNYSSTTVSLDYVLAGSTTMDGNNLSDVFTVVDWDLLVILPANVAFKGYNDLYLSGVVIDGYNYLQFASGDKGTQSSAYNVVMDADGYLRIQSKFFSNKFWRRSPNWIWADGTDTTSSNQDTLFWPVKVDDTTIALRNAGNNSFCKALSTEGKVNCLNASDPTISNYSKMQVDELISDREVYNVQYRMEDARIYNESPYIAGTGTYTNDSDEENTGSITISYTDTRTYSWSNTISLKLGISATFEAGIPLIFEEKIQISGEFNESYQWGEIRTETKTASATYTAKVPPNSKVTVNYLATTGTCDVPFSYTQRDKYALDGSISTTEKNDGVYTGINSYNFHFQEPEIEAL